MTGMVSGKEGLKRRSGAGMAEEEGTGALVTGVMSGLTVPLAIPLVTTRL